MGIYKGFKGHKIGDIIYVKNKVAGYYSGYAGNPIFYLTPDLPATVLNPQAVYFNSNKSYFVFVEFFSPITSKKENACIDYDNIAKRI